MNGANHGRILIVDDDQANREAFLELIAEHDFATEAAADGPDALALIETREFDVVLLDISMPGMDGFEVLRRIRAVHPPTSLPVIMMTGIDQRGAVLEALQLGASDYVVKPFDFAVALARIRTQLSLKRAVDHIVRLERDVEKKNRELQQANTELKEAYGQIKSDLEAAAQVQRALLP
ncbi:MAG: response regulator, partial [Planctomycetes bacterium]|nr:response regulator [Planctomycetota bacterium]